MRRHLILLSAAALLARAVVAQDRSDTQRAIAAIRKLGGEVTVGSEKTGAPVRVVLTGASSPADCLAPLKGVANLHTCDL
jgi:hypothetical protein